ncbi:hypothetical protein NB713_003938 [Xanthomonas sacchari]|nr:hypothetical protein [Xanthomonas sacchari]
MPRRTFAPGCIAPIIGGRSLEAPISVPLTVRITSPTSSPALAAGLPWTSWLTSAPRVSGRPRPCAFSESMAPTITPSWARVTLPVFLICSTALIARSIGIAKLMPM